MPKVSIIVPVYNVAPYLARCLDSLVGQTLHDIEIICIDDKSTDNSLEILHEYRNKDPRIQVIALDKNSGVSTARNTGIEAAHGEYLGFVDPDDYVDLDFYEKLYITTKHENADITRGNCRVTNFKGETYNKTKEMLSIQRNGKWYFIWQWWCAIYNKHMINTHNIKFPTNIISGQDGVFLKDCLRHTNKLAMCFDTHYNYIRREGSLSEEIMPPYKITSRMNSFRLTSEIYNQASYDNPDDYAFCFEDLILRTYEHFAKNTAIECKMEVSELIIELYKKCKDKVMLSKRLAMSLSQPAVTYIQSYDAKGLCKYFIQGTSHTEPDIKNSTKKYNIMLFSAMPVLQVKKSNNTFIIRFCGLQIFRFKNVNRNARIYILYIPIIRIKIK